MKNGKIIIICLLVLFLFQGLSSAQGQDVEGSSDHPLLPRMDNFTISGFDLYALESHEFYDAADNEYVISGKKWVIEYTVREGFVAPGQLNVRKNYIDAVKEMGGTILFAEGLYMKVSSGNKEIWIDIWVDSDGSDYRITVVEKDIAAKTVSVLKSPKKIMEEKEDPDLQRVKNALYEIKQNQEVFLSSYERIAQDINWCLEQVCPGGVKTAPSVPIPYPNFRAMTDLDESTKKVAADGAAIMAKESRTAKSEGDELGSSVTGLRNLIQSRIKSGDLSEKDKTAFTDKLISYQQKAKGMAKLFERYVEEVEQSLELWK